jgi:O-antigen/teichoic acid export membrane protein
MLPRIAAMDDAEAQRKQLTPLIARHVLWFNLIAGGLVALLASPVILFLYSAEFGSAAGALRILLPGVILMSISKILANDIAGRGHPEVNSRQSTVAFIINLVANLLLIPRMGINGAALATAISYSSLMLLNLFVYCRLAAVRWQEVILPQPGDWPRIKYGAQYMLTRFSRSTH